MMFKRQLSQDEMRRAYPAIFAEAEKETLSDKYLYIPTFKLVDGLERAGFKVVGAKQQNTRKEGNKEFAKHVVYMTHESQQEQMLQRVGEEIPMLALTNSHNGLSSFAIDTAFFMLACSNGLLMPTDNTFSSARITHKKGMESDVIEASYRVIKSFPEQIAQISEMKAIALNADERKMLAIASANIAFDEKLVQDNAERNPLDRALLRPRRYADSGQDLWTTFNVIQENVIKGGFRAIRKNEENNRTTIARMRAVNSIDRDTKLNKELMALALKMKELKSIAI